MAQFHPIDWETLEWIAAEVTQALARARQLLGQSSTHFDAALLREAQTHLFAARSAVEVANIAPLPRVLSLFDQAVEALLASPTPPHAALCALTEIVVAVENLWYDLIHTRQWQPLRLRPHYERLAQLAHDKEAHPADLFLIPYPPSAGLSTSLSTEEADAARRRLRHRFTQALAQWFQRGDVSDLLPAREALIGRLQLDGGTPQEPLWIAATAFLEAIIRKTIPVGDRDRALLAAVQRTLRDPLPAAAQTMLFRQLVLPLAKQRPQTRVQRLMHRYWRLSDWVAHADQPLPSKPLIELDQALRAAAQEAQRCWDRVDTPWPERSEALLLVARALYDRQDPAAERLASQIETFAQHLPEAANEATTFLTATTLLALERDGQLGSATLSELAENWAKTLAGQPALAPHISLSGSADAALAAEVMGLCGEIEQMLDQYWRAPEGSLPLSALKKQLDQLSAIAVVTNHHDLLPEIEAVRCWLQEVADGKRRFDPSDPLVAKIATWGHRLTSPAALSSDAEQPTLTAIPWPELFRSASLPDATAGPTQPTSGKAVPATDASATVPAPPPEATASPPPALSAAPEPTPTGADDEMAELRAIFLAECEEILAAMGQAEEQLRHALSNREALTAWRRQVHTLKGSSRIVGLTQLGETAWEVEQTLNQWLRDPAFVVDAAALDFLVQCRSAFTEAAQAIAATGSDLPEPIQAVVAAAQAWRQSPAEPAAESSPRAPFTPPQEAKEVAASVLALQNPALNVPQPEVPPAPAELETHTPAYATLPETEEAQPEIVVVPPPSAEAQLSEPTEPPLTEPSEPALAQEEPLPEPVPLPDIDFTPEHPEEAPATGPSPTTPPARVVFGDRQVSRSLFEVFRAEAREHLATLARYIYEGASPPPDATIRAVHTLAGICGTVQIPEMHEVARAVENALKHFAKEQTPLSGAAHALLSKVHDALFTDLITVENGAIPPLRSDLIAELHALSHAPAGEAAPAATEQAPLAAPPSPHEAPPSPAAPTEAPARPEPTKAPTPPAPSETPEPPAVPHKPSAPVPAISAPVAPSPVAPSALQRTDEPPSDHLDPELKAIFTLEGEELFARLDAALDTLPPTANKVTDAQIEPILRLLHTLKGSARMAGALALGERIHRLEEQLKTQKEAAIAALPDEIAAARAHFRMLLAGAHSEVALLPTPAQPEAKTKRRGRARAKEAGESAAPLPEKQPAATSAPSTTAPALASSADFEPLTATAAAATMTLRLPAALVDRWVNELGELSIQRARAESALVQLRQGATDLTDNVTRLRQHLRELEIQAEAQLQARIQVAETQHTQFDPLEMDRYTRLQELTRILAEGIADIATLQQTILQATDQAEVNLNRQARQTRSLQAELTALRSVPVTTVRDRLERVVHQTAAALGKEAQLALVGEQTRIDRAVLERLVPALEHLLRNAVAHGIESPAEREAHGKPRTGMITLTVRAVSGESQWMLADDGRGLDYARILTKARERGWVAPDQQPSETELAQLIFRSGFSTAETVSQIAGRGVGMDVVQAEVTALGGRIEVTSTPGAGTRFFIRLPTELTLVSLLLISHQGQRWAIPTEWIVHTQQLKAEALKEARQRGTIEHLGASYPLTSFATLIGAPEPPPSGRYWILFCQSGDEARLAIAVEGIVGRQELLAKPSGPLLRRIPGMLGAVLLPDGAIALIVQPLLLSRAAPDPARAALSAEATATKTEPASASPAKRQAPPILVIDDSLTVRRLTQRFLERHGYQVLLAKDGQEALEVLEGHHPALILSDIEMPRMDGFELLRHLRARPQTHNVPVVMITSRLAEKHRQHALELGATEYLGKPYQEETLLALLDRYAPISA